MGVRTKHHRILGECAGADEGMHKRTDKEEHMWSLRLGYVGGYVVRSTAQYMSAVATSTQDLIWRKGKERWRYLESWKLLA